MYALKFHMVESRILFIRPRLLAVELPLVEVLLHLCGGDHVW